MYFEEALRTELMSITDFNTKVFPLTATEGVTTPYIVYISSEGVQERYLSGYSPRTKEIDCEIHILSDSYGSVKDYTRQVIAKILTFPDRVIGGAGGVPVLDLTYEKVDERYIDDLYQYLVVIAMTVRL